jgi:hypothetical protein
LIFIHGVVPPAFRNGLSSDRGMAAGRARRPLAW